MSGPAWGWAVAGFGLGAIAGSFLATIVIRWPRGLPVSAGRSRCDGCGRTLRWVELIPLVSAVRQRGRCRGCGAAIDPDHARIEWGAAAVGALAFGLAPGAGGAAWAMFGWLLLTLAVLDWRHFWLPDRLTVPLALAGLIAGGWASGVALGDRAIGAAAGWAALWAIAAGYRRARGREGLGAGDAKLLGAIGAWLGWQALPLVLLAASLSGLIAVGLAAARGSRIGRDSPVPFGVALAAGALPGWLASGWLGR